MDSTELVREIPRFIGKYVGGVPDLTPLVAPVGDLDAGAWLMRQEAVLTAIKLLGDDAEMRINVGLAVNVPYAPQVAERVNFLNLKRLEFGRMFVLQNPSQGVCAVMMQEIVFGESLSFDFPPSMQNLLKIVRRMTALAAQVAPELIDEFGGQPFSEDTSMILTMV